jgi:cardiolipin synthase A/B
MVRLTGPIVRELDAVFVTDWYSETDELLPLDTSPVRPEDDQELVDAQIVPSGPSFDNDNNLKLFTAMIQNARQRVSITSPYYVPDETIQMALVTAGSRGLDVELFVSEIGDQFMVFHAQRSYYEQLLRAGVKIYLYRAPTILHVKHLSIDDDVAVIGSSNLDIRSLSLHMERSVLVHGAKFTAAMRAVEDDYRSKSRQVVLQEWLRRPRREQIFDNLMRLHHRCNDRWSGGDNIPPIPHSAAPSVRFPSQPSRRAVTRPQTERFPAQPSRQARRWPERLGHRSLLITNHEVAVVAAASRQGQGTAPLESLSQ